MALVFHVGFALVLLTFAYLRFVHGCGEVVIEPTGCISAGDNITVTCSTCQLQACSSIHVFKNGQDVDHGDNAVINYTQVPCRVEYTFKADPTVDDGAKFSCSVIFDGPQLVEFERITLHMSAVLPQLDGQCTTPAKQNCTLVVSLGDGNGKDDDMSYVDCASSSEPSPSYKPPTDSPVTSRDYSGEPTESDTSGSVYLLAAVLIPGFTVVSICVVICIAVCALGFHCYNELKSHCLQLICKIHGHVEQTLHLNMHWPSQLEEVVVDKQEERNGLPSSPSPRRPSSPSVKEDPQSQQKDSTSPVESRSQQDIQPLLPNIEGHVSVESSQHKIEQANGLHQLLLHSFIPPTSKCNEKTMEDKYLDIIKKKKESDPTGKEQLGLNGLCDINQQVPNSAPSTMLSSEPLESALPSSDVPTVTSF